MKIILCIKNEKGLHARASAKFVETVEQFDATADVWKGSLNACGDSIMGLLMLGASKGSSIVVETKGRQAVELTEALKALVNNCFGEDC